MCQEKGRDLRFKRAKMMARVRHERRVLGERKKERGMISGENTYRLEKAVGT